MGESFKDIVVRLERMNEIAAGLATESAAIYREVLSSLEGVNQLSAAQTSQIYRTMSLLAEMTSTLSDVLKKCSDTDQGMIQNLK